MIARKPYSPRELSKSLREGRFTSIGGYPKYWLTASGRVLSLSAIRENLLQCYRATRAAELGRDCDRDWAICAVDVNWEDRELFCEETSVRIESAYAEAP